MTTDCLITAVTLPMRMNRDQHGRRNKMKRITKGIAWVVSAMIIMTGTAPLLRAEAAPQTRAEKRDIHVYRRSMDENETVECLFFDDMPNVPYMSMELYYKVFFDGEMTVTSHGGGKYTYLESMCGDAATVDTVTDAFTTDDLASFVATPVYKMEGVKFVMYGPDLLVKPESVSYDKPAKPVTIDLGRYGIDIREEDGVVYYPFVTLSDLFGNVDYVTSVYSDEKIYFMAYYDDINGGQARNEDSTCLSSLSSGSRPQDVIDMTYKELQFSLEYFYGYPSDRNPFAAEMKSSGLDAALTKLQGRTKELLLSPLSGEYIAGMDRLFNYHLADGGHTGLLIDKSLMSMLDDTDIGRDYSNGISDIDDLVNEYTRKIVNIKEIHMNLSELKNKALGSGNYFSSGSTALISFDSFDVDYQGWRDYWGGKSSSMPDDTVSILYNGLIRASSEGMRNVVLDISTNFGGDTVALHEVLGIIIGDYSFLGQNLLGDQTVTQKNLTDRNLDGVIDIKDKLVSFDDINFAVLTSGSSFSCATLFPTIMKDEGYMIMGERCGGGTCAVLQRATADGVIYAISSYARFVNKDMKTVDDGVPVDVSFVSKAADGSVNYSGFYDIDRMGREMDAFYAAKRQQESSAMDESSVVSRDEQSSQVSLTESSVFQPSHPESGQEISSESIASAVSAENGSGWISVVVTVFVVLGLIAFGLFVVGIIAIRRK